MATPEEKQARDLLRVARSPDWEMPAGFERMLPLMLMEIVAKKKDDGKSYAYSTRARQSAMRLLKGMKKDNDTREAPPQMHIHTQGTIDDVRQEMMSHDPEYLEFLRAREADRDARAIREEGDGGHVEDRGSSADDRPGLDECD